MYKLLKRERGKERKMIVCLMSGGLDSSTMALKMLMQGHEIVPVFVRYGQRHLEREESAARSIVDWLLSSGANLRYLDFTQLMESFKSSLIVSSGIEVRDDVVRGDLGGTYVPMRNTLFLSAAAGLVESMGGGCIAYAGHAEDAEANYPDCTKEFVQAYSEMLNAATDGAVKLIAPFIEYTKGDIIKECIKLLDSEGAREFLSKTYSCYRGGDKHCGTCPTCRGRKKAFKDAGLEDPTFYVDEV